MELEFDKEIDAILKRARPQPALAGVVANGPHLDADTIAAFAENALPANARSRFTLHLVDCDRCRKNLTDTIRLQENIVETATPVVAPAAAKVSTPWYAGLFRTPSLAAAMGGLLLVFTGVLGFLLIQNNRDAQNSVITQVRDEEQRPQISDLPAEPMANTTALDSNSAAGTATTDATADTNMLAKGAQASNSAAANIAPGKSQINPEQDALAGAAEPARSLNEARPVTAQPPPPPPAPSAGAAATEAVTSQADSPRDDSETARAERSDSSLAARRNVPGDSSASREVTAGDTRSKRAARVENRAQTDGSASALRAVGAKRAGGKTFTSRDGAWYDTDYRGQATTNIRRGTDAFKQLDGNLRQIANQIDGVVVVVWRSRAYRIQ